METGGVVEILQLWVNLPARLKYTPPAYIGLQAEEIPEISFDEGRVKVRLISGQWNNAAGPIQSISDVHLAILNMGENVNARIPVPAGRRVLFYVVRGSVTVNGALAETNE